MVDILHRVGIKSSVAEVYAALTTAEGLAGRWTTDTQSEGNDLDGSWKEPVEFMHHCSTK
jgi:uncharacterized protein YndB with AHSA1/START domain